MLFNYNHVFIVSYCITIRSLCSGMSNENPHGSHLRGFWVYHRALVDLSMPILNKCIVDPISIIVNHVTRSTMNAIFTPNYLKIMGLPCSSPTIEPLLNHDWTTIEPLDHHWTTWTPLNHYWTQQKGAEAAGSLRPVRLPLCPASAVPSLAFTTMLGTALMLQAGFWNG